ncbi:hypothetical protein CRYUN_Cryun08bG0084800 [Craigia yunnanensis]
MLHEEYMAINRREHSETSQVREQWQPLSVGFMKINADAGFCVSTGEARLGVVARDSSGYVWFCAATKRRGIQSPLQTELLAILYGLELALEKDFLTIQIESDSSLAISEISKNNFSFCSGGYYF